MTFSSHPIQSQPRIQYTPQETLRLGDEESLSLCKGHGGLRQAQRWLSAHDNIEACLILPGFGELRMKCGSQGGEITGADTYAERRDYQASLAHRLG